jgi:para-aminobenzoate synthetase component 1
MLAAAIIKADWREPADVLAAFADEPWAIGLLSGGDPQQARWSYLARRPSETLVIGPQDPRDPFEALRALIGPPATALPDGPPFQGGVAGLACYELGERIDPIGLARRPGWPDLTCARYPALLAFDHRDHAVMAIGRGDNDAAARQVAAEALSWLTTPSQPRVSGPLAEAPIVGPAEDYEGAVAEVVARIAAGDIFQANVARAWIGRLFGDARPFDLMNRLTRSSPAPFAAYLRLDDRAVVSNAPERFVQLSRSDAGLHARTQPIKGTRPRGADPAEDAALAAALAASPKDRAENLMIVDLMRNDLARVSRPGAVRTPELFRVESFANVHHLVSTVTGALAPGRDAADLLRATFPPGSITGAPKLQAMRTIAALEPPRGPFFGSMFWAGADGAMDASVLIRTVAFERDADGWTFEARAGAGIVADSDPLTERHETEAKISAILAALRAPAG